ncbi:hypothetical protein AGMMS49546_25990 [Spirochaetia bacterium]|nr:hypothetical protein AGMMS49546_25990 [Spirochaetia bacterium]
MGLAMGLVVQFKKKGKSEYIRTKAIYSDISKAESVLKKVLKNPKIEDAFIVTEQGERISSTENDKVVIKIYDSDEVLEVSEKDLDGLPLIEDFIKGLLK